MLAIVAPLLAFLTVPNGEGDEFAAMRAAAEAGLPSNAAGPQRESRTVLGTASNTCSDTPGWTNPHGWGCAWYDALWCAGGSYRPGQAFALGKRFDYPEVHCCSCGKGELDDIYRQRGQEGKITGCISSNALGPCMDYCTRVQGSLDNYCALLQGSLGN